MLQKYLGSPRPIGAIKKIRNVRSLNVCFGFRFIPSANFFKRDFLFNLVKYHRTLIPRSLNGFNSRTHPGVDNMCPVFAGVLRQVSPPLDNENTGVAHLPCPLLGQLETVGKINLVLCTAGKSRAGRLAFILSLTPHIVR